MSGTIEKLRNLAKLNFCEKCYSKYLVLFQAEIEYILSEPLADWRQTEANIDILWIKAKRYYKIKNSTIFSPSKSGFKKSEDKSVCCKLTFLKEKGEIGDCTFEFLNVVRRRRNKVHPPERFSEQDYLMFREAKTLTDTLHMHAVRNVKDKIWKNDMARVEKRAKTLLEKFQLN